MFPKKVILSAIGVILIGWMFIPIQTGFLIADVKAKKPLLFIPSTNREMTISWRHSVELQPWEETYEADMSGLLNLVETRLKAYGAGVPDVEGKIAKYENGMLVIREINRQINTYSLFHSENSHYRLTVDQKIFQFADSIPFDIGVNITFKRMSFIQLVFIQSVSDK